MMTAMKAVRETPYGQRVIPQAECSCGEDSTELDHIVPLAVAARRSRREWVRAFLPSNLQWLCQACHRAKTVDDMAAIAGLKNPDGHEQRQKSAHAQERLKRQRELMRQRQRELMQAKLF